MSMNVQWAALCVACARAKDLPCLGELPADVGVGDEGSESVALVARESKDLSPKVAVRVSQ